MSTIINNPSGENGSGSSTGLIVGIVVVILVIALLFIVGANNEERTPNDANVNVPGQQESNDLPLIINTTNSTTTITTGTSSAQ